MSDPSPAPVPSRIGRYEIRGSLGTGSMGAVYKGFDPLIKRTLAIKTIRLDVTRDSDEYRTFLERFHQEARISGTLSHPNIVTLYDIGEEAGVPFLAMEFIDGETLEALLESGTRFSPEQAVAIVAQVAAALDYAHSRGVIHRDIKPANLLVFERDRVKITDFGIAKLADANLTKFGQLLGTPSYMSPEQATGETLDGRSDIFSLGVVAFEILSGIQPFVGEQVPDIVYNIVHEPPQPPPDLEARGLLPGRWDQVFGRALAKRREERYQSGAELSRELELCLATPIASTATRPPSFVPAPAPPPVRTVPPRAVVAKDDTPTPPASPTPDSLMPTETRQVGLDEPTVVMTPEEASELDGAAGEKTEAVPETIALGPGDVPRFEPPDREPPGDEAPTILTGAARQGEEPTILMSPEEAELPPTQKLSPQEARDLVADSPLYAPDSSSAPTAPQGVRRPAESVTAGGRGRALWIGGAAAAVLVALLIWWLAGRTGPPPAAIVGSIAVTTEPPGAAIWLDGTERGTSPVTIGELGEGTYRVRAVLEGYEEAEEIVSIGPGASDQPVALTLAPAGPPTGRVDILSTPEGADVAIDGESVGRTPLTGLELEEGRYRVVLSLTGYRRWSGEVEVTSGETEELSPRLEARPPEPPPTTAPPAVEEPEAAAEPEPEPAPEEPAVVEEPTPTPVDTSRVYFPDQVDVRPEKISGNMPRPDLERGESLSVTVSYVVDENGDVAEVQIEESGGQELDEAMTEAIREWRHRPGTKQGVPVKVRLIRKFTFREG